MPSSLMRASAPIAGLLEKRRKVEGSGGGWRGARVRRARSPIVVDADEEERGPVRVGAPHDGVHVERLALGRTEAQPRVAADGKLRFEAHLGADGAQIDGVPLEAATARFDGDGPRHL